MTEMLRLIKEHDISAGDVVSGAGRHQPQYAERAHPPSPENELQAKFSMEFCMAILLLEGALASPNSPTRSSIGPM